MQPFTVRVNTAPATEPISVTEAKSFMGVTISSDDTLIGVLIQAAREAAEHYTRRAFITQTLELHLEGAPVRPDPWWDGVRQGVMPRAERNYIELPRAPLQSVTSVLYYTVDDTETTFSSSNYFVDADMEPGRVILTYGQSWPTNVRDNKALKVTYVAGYGNAVDVPAGIKRALYAQVSALYNKRDPSIQSQRVGEVSITYGNANVTAMHPERLAPEVRALSLIHI